MTPVADLYHGTRAPFGVGGYLFPVAHTGAPERPGYTSEDDKGYVYLTDDLDAAWWYAYTSQGRGKPKVLVLHPTGSIEHDPSPYDEERHNQYRSRAHAKVVRIIRTEDPS